MISILDRIIIIIILLPQYGGVVNCSDQKTVKIFRGSGSTHDCIRDYSFRGTKFWIWEVVLLDVLSPEQCSGSFVEGMQKSVIIREDKIV